MAAEKSQPVHQYRLGKIVGAVWFNEDDNGRGTHTVQIARLYRPNDEDGWPRASRFRRYDLPLVAKVADRCHTWIHEIWQQSVELASGLERKTAPQRSQRKVSRPYPKLQGADFRSRKVGTHSNSGSRRLRILPVGVVGRSSRILTFLGTLNPASDGFV